jgi:hypothetical protein
MVKYINTQRFKNDMLNKTFIFTFIFIMVISFTSAYQESLGTFKQNENVKLIQTCSICSYVTLDSIKYPDGTMSIYNINMTKNGSTFYYNFNLTSQLGEYIYNTHYGNYTAPVGFEITPNGQIMGLSQSIIFGFVFLIIIGLLVFSIMGLSRSSDVSWLIFYICSTYIMSFCMFFVAWLLSSNYLWQTPILASVFWIIWLVMSILFFPFIIGVSGYILKLQAEALMVDDYVSKGYSQEDAKSLAKTKRKR